MNNPSDRPMFGILPHTQSLHVCMCLKVQLEKCSENGDKKCSHFTQQSFFLYCWILDQACMSVLNFKKIVISYKNDMNYEDEKPE